MCDSCEDNLDELLSHLNELHETPEEQLEALRLLRDRLKEAVLQVREDLGEEVEAKEDDDDGLFDGDADEDE